MVITHKTEILGQQVEYVARTVNNEVFITVPRVAIRGDVKHVHGVKFKLRASRSHFPRLYALCRMDLKFWNYIGVAIADNYLERLT